MEKYLYVLAYFSNELDKIRGIASFSRTIVEAGNLDEAYAIGGRKFAKDIHKFYCGINDWAVPLSEIEQEQLPR